MFTTQAHPYSLEFLAEHEDEQCDFHSRNSGGHFDQQDNDEFESGSGSLMHTLLG